MAKQGIHRAVGHEPYFVAEEGGSAGHNCFETLKVVTCYFGMCIWTTSTRFKNRFSCISKGNRTWRQLRGYHHHNISYFSLKIIWDKADFLITFTGQTGCDHVACYSLKIMWSNIDFLITLNAISMLPNRVRSRSLLCLCLKWQELERHGGLSYLKDFTILYGAKNLLKR